MSSCEISTGNFSNSNCLIPLIIKYFYIICAPGQISECISVCCSISCRRSKEGLDLSTESNLCIRFCPPLHELPGLIPKLFILSFDHHSRTTCDEVWAVDSTIRHLCSGDKCEVPKASDLRCWYHKCVICWVRRNTYRHLTWSKSTYKVINNRQTIVIEVSYIIIKCSDTCFCIDCCLCTVFIVHIPTILIEKWEVHWKIRLARHNWCWCLCSSAVTGCCRNSYWKVLTLDCRHHFNKFLPCLRRFKSQFFKYVLSIEHNIEGLCLRETINMSIKSVLLVWTLWIVSHYILPAIELSNILSCTTECVVDRLVCSYGKNYVWSSSCKYCIKKRIRSNNFYVNLYSAFRCESIIYHGLKDCTLITSGKYPYLYYLIWSIWIIYITDWVIIYKEGCNEGFNLMSALCKEICFIFLRWYSGSWYYQIINIQLCITHIKWRCTKCSYVILKGCKLCCNLLRLSTESFKLLSNCLSCSNVISHLSWVSNHVINGLV